MYYPTLEQVKDMAGQGNLVPVYREIMADLETPVSAYLKTAHGPYSFLLESVEGGERLARYSFLGTDPYMVLRTKRSGEASAGGDPLRHVKSELAQYKVVAVPGLPRFHGGAVGYLSYEAVQHFEKLPSPEADTLGMPEAVFMFADTLLVFDHLQHKIKVVSHVHLNDGIAAAYAAAIEKIEALVTRLSRPTPMVIGPSDGEGKAGDGRFRSNLTQGEYERAVRKAKEYIKAGDIIQVVPSQRLAMATHARPFTVYRALRTINPSPYMYYLHLDDCSIVGASPEMLVRVENGIVATHPIAGTRRRGRDEAEDFALEQELKRDEKERAEHLMLLDLGRNDIGRVSEAGSVRVTQMMEVERYSHVMHLVSHVTGKLRPGCDSFDALRACFPAGTVSGAPKVRAMEIIAELEPDKRGPYAGAVGNFSYSGNLDTAITIRTILMKEGIAYVQAGGGVVADSEPELEYQESLNKARALLKAIVEAEAWEDRDAAADRQLRQFYI